MADDILKNTLTGTLASTPAPPMPKGLQVPDSTGNVKRDIANLSGAQKKPSMLMDFQKAMQLTSQTAYNERQTKEMEITGTQFDPTKVSGGTFSNIIGNLESKRGADISKIYKSTMDTYQAVQAQVTQRLQFLEQQEAARKEFEATMEAREEELKRLKKNDAQDYEMEVARFKFDKEKFAYSKTKIGSGGSSQDYSEDYEEKLLSGFNQITVGYDGYVNPYEANRWMADGAKNAKTSDDIKLFNKKALMLEKIRNPRDLVKTGGGRD